ncbi:hypothetical protein FOMG_17763 [Fusarium oxysporum f. sp. melonis 26406]|uniref:Uncharacterized protein n=1 Tax=Fusarium oxysporum f. sp. melonis 26406 TaxID=1089452 RepID=W9ZX08_FUSOX|nr:hypothetical protein FOMG_17763 [Fusarium oxysporum f. sp. melonis 26406]
MIEIAMGDDLPSGSDQASEASPPAPASHRSHNRGDSVLPAAVERSMSDPPFEAPYESIPMPRQMKYPPPVPLNPDVLSSPISPRSKHLSTGLNRNEMI